MTTHIKASSASVPVTHSVGIFRVDRTRVFDPTEFLGEEGWDVWRGPKDDDGLIGDVEQDMRSLSLDTIDLSKLNFGIPLGEGEIAITGEEKLLREERDVDLIRLDASFIRDLCQEYGHRTLESLYENYGIRWLEATGTVLRGPRGRRYVLCTRRQNDGAWLHGYLWLEHIRRTEYVSVRLENYVQ